MKITPFPDAGIVRLSSIGNTDKLNAKISFAFTDILSAQRIKLKTRFGESLANCAANIVGLTVVENHLVHSFVIPTEHIFFPQSSHAAELSISCCNNHIYIFCFKKTFVMAS